MKFKFTADVDFEAANIDEAERLERERKGVV